MDNPREAREAAFLFSRRGVFDPRVALGAPGGTIKKLLGNCCDTCSRGRHDIGRSLQPRADELYDGLVNGYVAPQAHPLPGSVKLKHQIGGLGQVERIGRRGFLLDHNNGPPNPYLCKPRAMIGATAPGPGSGGLMAGVLARGATGPMGQRSMGSVPKSPLRPTSGQMVSEYFVQLIIPLY